MMNICLYNFQLCFYWIGPSQAALPHSFHRPQTDSWTTPPPPHQDIGSPIRPVPWLTLTWRYSCWRSCCCCCCRCCCCCYCCCCCCCWRPTRCWRPRWGGPWRTRGRPAGSRRPAARRPGRRRRRRRRRRIWSRFLGRLRSHKTRPLCRVTSELGPT